MADHSAHSAAQTSWTSVEEMLVEAAVLIACYPRAPAFCIPHEGRSCSSPSTGEAMLNQEATEEQDWDRPFLGSADPCKR